MILKRKPEENNIEYDKRQRAEDEKTVKPIMACLDGLTVSEAKRLLGIVRSRLDANAILSYRAANE